MNQQKTLIRIAELLSRFKIQTNILNANAQLDINIISEDILIPILNIAYVCNLTNAKYSEKDIKFPALDLLDKNNKIAFQITSTSTIKKIRETIEKIAKNNFYKLFDVFYIYIITQKHDNYNKSVLETATQGLFVFTKNNIIDEKDLFQKIASLPYNDIINIEKILEKQFSDTASIEKTIQNGIEEIVKQIKMKYDEQLLVLKLEGLCKVRQSWLNKKIFYENKLPSISDVSQEFTIYNQIAEINEKIEFYNNQVLEILTLI